MFKIGDFARFNKVTVKTLRHYEKVGLLMPIYVDQYSGYRYYSAGQIDRLNNIIALKCIGFSLSEIAILIETNLSKGEMVRIFKLKEEEIIENIRLENEKHLRIKSIINSIENGEKNMEYNIVIKESAAIKAASLRDIIPEYSAQCHLWQELNEHLQNNNIKTTGPCFVIYHDNGFKESDVDIQICKTISQDFPETERIKNIEIDAVKEMACTIHKGAYENLSSAYHALLKWIEENNYEIAGENRELYIEGEWSTDNIEDYITEIQVPVKRK
ncbi:GyrI-like domain-containing protein [Clostridium aestuarii]|uniref:GyrI-like domain-containing protein n=2 Tax=Clostridium aestuarii TaxID=338193 RepID=A0ABT4D5S1_9CLOT|nr:GyrI-like domain-containing protein [Clostridium aestuarii]MCY6485378.1 GyrI-like domain-containing protein [Clostridium aestuarii]